MSYNIFNDFTASIGNLLELENDSNEGNKVKLYKSASDNYVLDDGNGQDILKGANGAKISVAERTKAGWKVVHASSDGKGGYKVAWEHTSGGARLWNTDANGKAAHRETFYKSIQEVEAILDYDIDDDGIKGPSLISIENDADEGNKVKLYKSASDNYVLDDGNGQDILKDSSDSNVSVASEEKLGWKVIHASSEAEGGYNVVWENSDGSVRLWVTDSTGKRVEEKEAGNYYNTIEDIESIVGYDINDDGTEGYVWTYIENDDDEGNSILLYTSRDLCFFEDGSSILNVLKHKDGSKVSVSGQEKLGWKVVHVSSDGQGDYNVAWEHTNGTARFWKTDSRGKEKTSKNYNSIKDIETIVGYDINDDGKLGHKLTIMENDADEGNTIKLYKSSDDHYVMDDGNGQDILKGANGANVSVAERTKAGWKVVHASSDGKGGYKVAWEGTNGSARLWDTDANGKAAHRETFYKSIQEVEAILGYDIDDDGIKGPPLISIENDADEGNKVKLYKSASDNYVLDDGNGQDILKGANGVNVSVAERTKAGWKVVHASSDGKGGYKVAWEGTNGSARLWDTDANGKAAHRETFYKSIQEVEAILGYDIDDDGIKGPPLISIENDADEGNTVKLYTSSKDNYVLDDGNGQDILKGANGVNVSVAERTKAGWKVVHASSDGKGGYKVAWEGTNGSARLWDTDANGKAAHRETFYKSIQEVEAILGYDIDDDGIKGPPLISIENDADEGNTVKLYTSSKDNYVLDDGNGQDILKGANGVNVSVAERTKAGWKVVHASSDGKGGYKVAWEGTNGSARLWNTDANGKAAHRETFYKSIQEVEAILGYDIDDDGVKGPPLISIENDADEGNTVKLYKSSKDNYVLDDGNGQDILKGANGVNVSVAERTKAGWKVVHASSDGKGGYKVAWEDTNGSARLWDTDANGKAKSDKIYKSIQEIETIVGYDIDDDGVKGPPLISIENDADEGNTVKLYKSAGDNYVLDDGKGQDSLKSANGTNVSVAERTKAGWKVVHASSDGKGGYKVAWEHTSGAARLWDTDANGKAKSDKIYKSIQEIETIVGYDIDDDGVKGPPLISIENDADEGNTVKLYKSAGDNYVLDDGKGQDILKGANGAKLSVAERTKAGWKVVHASSDGKGGYKVAWEHTSGAARLWDTDANGRAKSDKIYKSIHEIETIVGYDIDDDGVKGSPLTSIENDADEGNTVKLYKSAGDHYVMDDGNGQDILKDWDGTIMSASGQEKVGWKVVHASSDGKGGYNVAWEHKDGKARLWKTDANGQRKTGKEGEAYHSSIKDIEVILSYDIDDDGMVGTKLTIIENDVDEGNTVKLYKSTDDVYVLDDGNGQDILKDYSSNYSVAREERLGWKVVHASSNGKGGYNVAWEHKHGLARLWGTNSDGKLGRTGDFDSIGEVESIVGYDINDDGIKGPTFISMENDKDEGNPVILYESTKDDAYVMYDGAGRDTLKDEDGSKVSVKSEKKFGWKVVHASSDGKGGYNVAWEHSSGSAILWKTDASGQRVAGKEGETYYGNIKEVEDIVGYDIDDDGTIDTKLTRLENDWDEGNPIRLYKSASDNYGLKIKLSFITLKHKDGSAMYAGRDGWKVVHAHRDPSGDYTVVLEHSSGKTQVWEANSSGIGTPVHNRNYNSVKEAEPIVGYDIDDDGMLGSDYVRLENDWDERNIIKLYEHKVAGKIHYKAMYPNGDREMSVAIEEKLGWKVVHASFPTSGDNFTYGKGPTWDGYNAAWEHSDGRGRLSIGSWEKDYNSIKEIEPIVGYDINDDGVVAAENLTAIDNDNDEGNSIKLYKSTKADYYYFVENGGVQVVLKDEGAIPISVAKQLKAGQELVHVRSDRMYSGEDLEGGYKAVWKHADGTGEIWTMRANGQHKESRTETYQSLKEIEDIVGYDIDDDGIVGSEFTAIENDRDEGNTLALYKSTNDTYVFSGLSDGGKSGKVTLKHKDGSIVSVASEEKLGWKVVHVSESWTGTKIVWEHTDGNARLWSSGISGGEKDYSSIKEIEPIVGYDIDDDGIIVDPKNLTAIENDTDEGNTVKLYKSIKDDIYVMDDGSGQAVLKGRSGSLYSPADHLKHHWELVHVSSDGKGCYNLVMKRADGLGNLEIIDATGIYRWGFEPRQYLDDIEAMVGYDIDDDGLIAGVKKLTSSIEVAITATDSFLAQDEAGEDSMGTSDSASLAELDYYSDATSYVNQGGDDANTEGYALL